eukprot:TRINITY_DN3352_c1_g1_i1.p1 TRINITY_DN3352_c1_g1~~TRINITY_DN3352_c1_g1_i1.p1  ORF type:complete len:442 (+),score=138.16 TRINITY_DN3352_c1_g1_i1:244-1569(+)
MSGQEGGASSLSASSSTGTSSPPHQQQQQQQQRPPTLTPPQEAPPALPTPSAPPTAGNTTPSAPTGPTPHTNNTTTTTPHHHNTTTSTSTVSPPPTDDVNLDSSNSSDAEDTDVTNSDIDSDLTDVIDTSDNRESGGREGGSGVVSSDRIGDMPTAEEQLQQQQEFLQYQRDHREELDEELRQHRAKVQYYVEQWSQQLKHVPAHDDNPTPHTSVPELDAFGQPYFPARRQHVQRHTQHTTDDPLLRPVHTQQQQQPQAQYNDEPSDSENDSDNSDIIYADEPKQTHLSQFSHRGDLLFSESYIANTLLREQREKEEQAARMRRDIDAINRQYQYQQNHMFNPGRLSDDDDSTELATFNTNAQYESDNGSDDGDEADVDSDPEHASVAQHNLPYSSANMYHDVDDGTEVNREYEDGAGAVNFDISDGTIHGRTGSSSQFHD